MADILSDLVDAVDMMEDTLFNRFYRKAHQAAFADWMGNEGFPGLKARFHQGIDAGKARHYRLDAGGNGPYGYTVRRYQLGFRRNKTGSAPAAGSIPAFYAKDQAHLPAFVHTGKMRDELLARKPKSRHVGTAMITTFSLWANVIPLLKTKFGVVGRSKVSKDSTYSMTVYKDSVNRGGAYQMTVTRTTTRYEYQKSGTSQADEWLHIPVAEKAYLAERVEHHLNAMLRSAVFTKRGRLRSRYAERLREAA